MTVAPSTWHPTDDQLELYALQRLEVTEMPRLEQHLLLCESCMRRQQQIDEYVLLLQATLRDETSCVLPASVEQKRWGWNVPPKSQWAMALGTAAIAIGLVGGLQFRQAASPLPVTATLMAQRGADPDFILPVGHPLDLRLQTAGLTGKVFHMEIVDAVGQPVWIGTPAAAQGTVRVHIDRQFVAGQYWVRLYATAGGELLREYSLTLQ